MLSGKRDTSCLEASCKRAVSYCIRSDLQAVLDQEEDHAEEHGGDSEGDQHFSSPSVRKGEPLVGLLDVAPPQQHQETAHQNADREVSQALDQPLQRLLARNQEADEGHQQGHQQIGVE